jgi:hypothetical protein
MSAGLLCLALFVPPTRAAGPVADQLQGAQAAAPDQSGNVFDGSKTHQITVADDGSTKPVAAPNSDPKPKFSVTRDPNVPEAATRAKKKGGVDEVTAAGFWMGFNLCEFPAYMMISKHDFFSPFGYLLWVILVIPAVVLGGTAGIIAAHVSVNKAMKNQPKGVA